MLSNVSEESVNSTIVDKINTAVMMLEPDLVGKDGTLYVSKRRVHEVIKAVMEKLDE